MHPTFSAFLCAALAAVHMAGGAQAVPTGEVSGKAVRHTAQSLAEAVQGASVALPAAATGGAPYIGKWRDLPRVTGAKVPVVVFLHGSSGLGLKAIGEWQQWLAGMGIASVAPDSFALPERLTYKSPVGKEVYEQVHALRLSEVAPALQAVAGAQWADRSRLVLAGTSEGATAVARYAGSEFAARMIFSWSCEDNYFVQDPANALPATQPVLNVMSSTDVFFSPSNAWLGNPSARGHCGDALRDNRRAVVVLIPGAPHTLLNLPAVRAATATFLQDALAPR